VATAEIKRHWRRVSELGCLVTRRPEPTIHHCHGGSMLTVPGFVNPGMRQKSSDWLVIPLTMELHTGNKGIDVIGVKTWENQYFNQVILLDEVCRRIGVNVWAMAGIKRKVEIF